MEILNKIIELKKSIEETNELVEELIIKIDHHKNKNKVKESNIMQLKDEVRDNVQKIDEIIKDYNASS